MLLLRDSGSSLSLLDEALNSECLFIVADLLLDATSTGRADFAAVCIEWWMLFYLLPSHLSARRWCGRWLLAMEETVGWKIGKKPTATGGRHPFKRFG